MTEAEYKRMAAMERLMPFMSEEEWVKLMAQVMAIHSTADAEAVVVAVFGGDVKGCLLFWFFSLKSHVVPGVTFFGSFFLGVFFNLWVYIYREDVIRGFSSLDLATM